MSISYNICIVNTSWANRYWNLATLCTVHFYFPIRTVINSTFFLSLSLFLNDSLLLARKLLDARARTSTFHPRRKRKIRRIILNRGEEEEEKERREEEENEEAATTSTLASKKSKTVRKIDRERWKKHSGAAMTLRTYI